MSWGLSHGSIVKSGPVSLRDHVSNILDNLIASVIYSAAILAAVRFWPRAGGTLRASRNAVVRAGAAIFALPALLLRRLRAWLRPKPTIAWISGRGVSVTTGRAAITALPSRNTLIVPPTGSLTIITAPEPMPPGTASAIAMAMQPPVTRAPMQMPYVNTSHSVQAQYVQAELDQAARFAMVATMPKFNPAVLSTSS